MHSIFSSLGGLQLADPNKVIALGREMGVSVLLLHPSSYTYLSPGSQGQQSKQRCLLLHRDIKALTVQTRDIISPSPWASPLDMPEGGILDRCPNTDAEEH